MRSIETIRHLHNGINAILDLPFTRILTQRKTTAHFAVFPLHNSCVPCLRLGCFSLHFRVHPASWASPRNKEAYEDITQAPWTVGYKDRRVSGITEIDFHCFLYGDFDFRSPGANTPKDTDAG